MRTQRCRSIEQLVRDKSNRNGWETFSGRTEGRKDGRMALIVGIFCGNLTRLNQENRKSRVIYPSETEPSPGAQVRCALVATASRSHSVARFNSTVLL